MHFSNEGLPGTKPISPAKNKNLKNHNKFSRSSRNMKNVIHSNDDGANSDLSHVRGT